MNDCIFCKIIKGDIPSDKVYEDGNFIVIRDISPAYKKHLLIITKKHIASVNDVTENDGELFSSIFSVAKTVAENENFAGTGYRLTVNCGKDAGQLVPHFHMHILAGEPLRNL